MYIRRFKATLGLMAAAISATVLLYGCATPGAGGDDPVLADDVYGGEASVAYAQKLWSALGARRLAGPDSLAAKPYLGTHPHGAVLVAYETLLEVGGHTGMVVVKKNYDGEGVSVSSVANDPEQNLGAVTVMYKRETGYDADNQDWFWAKYRSDGSLDVNPSGVRLAGRVAKGKPEGCIACHKLAPGNDYIYNHNRFSN